MKRIVVSLLLSIAAATAVLGQTHDHHKAAMSAADVVNNGEVKRINSATGKITIAHGPLKAFDMPAMTMAFGVKDKALLGKVKAGDKVNFVLEKSGENLVITRIEPAR